MLLDASLPQISGLDRGEIPLREISAVVSVTTVTIVDCKEGILFYTSEVVRDGEGILVGLVEIVRIVPPLGPEGILDPNLVVAAPQLRSLGLGTADRPPRDLRLSHHTVLVQLRALLARRPARPLPVRNALPRIPGCGSHPLRVADAPARSHRGLGDRSRGGGCAAHDIFKVGIDTCILLDCVRSMRFPFP